MKLNHSIPCQSGPAGMDMVSLFTAGMIIELLECNTNALVFALVTKVYRRYEM